MGQYLMLGLFVTKMIRTVFIALDIAIYRLAKYSYSVFCFISKVTLLNDSSIELFMRRIYAILGIFMIFVFAYNLLSYIVNPDRMTDNKNGASALIKDIVIALVVITISPIIFTKLYSFQNTIITRGVISNLITGGYTENGVSIDQNDPEIGRKYIEHGANVMIADVFSGFVSPISGNFDTTKCGDKETAEYKANVEYCEAYNEARSTGSIWKFESIVLQDDKYDYHWLISTAAGVVLAFFMLAFCLDLGKRVGKMSLLQLIAPIPLIIEILPNKKGSRKKWFDELIKTYLEVFIFQATVFLVMFLIQLVPGILSQLFGEWTSSDGSFFVNTLAMIFIIFGLLQFGKEVPKLVTDLLGIKSSGIIGAAFKRGITMAGVTGGLLGSTVGRFSRNFNSNPEDSIGDRLLSGLGGAGSGLVRNLWGARNVHSLKDAKALRQKVNQDVITARVQRDAYARSHPGGINAVLEGHILDAGRAAELGIRSFLGAPNEYQTRKYTEEINTQLKQLYETEVASIWKNDATWSSYDSLLKQAEAQGVGKGGTFSVNGVTYNYDDVKRFRDTRQAKLVETNGTKIMKGAEKVNQFIDAHQGVRGVTTTRFDTKKAIKSDGTGDMAFIAEMEKHVKGNKKLRAKAKDSNGWSMGGAQAREGYEPVLADLKEMLDFQQEKIATELRGEAKDVNKQAADAQAKKTDAGKDKK